MIDKIKNRINQYLKYNQKRKIGRIKRFQKNHHIENK